MRLTKYRLVKDNIRNTYFTESNFLGIFGWWYVSGSISYDKSDAITVFENLKKTGTAYIVLAQ